MEIRNGSLDFSLPLLGSGPRSAEATVVFPRAVHAAGAGITAYTAAHPSGDRPFGRIEVHLETKINLNAVIVTGWFGLRDWSGNWGDAHAGTIEFTVVRAPESASF